MYKNYAILLSVEEGGFLFLPIGVLNELKLDQGDLLFAARGSHLGLSFLSKGPIINEANNHPKLQVFE
ncbi:MAG: hypothetical protein ACFE9L_00040 [Candidatus Hodarchaeota archaeon]